MSYSSGTVGLWKEAWQDIQLPGHYLTLSITPFMPPSIERVYQTSTSTGTAKAVNTQTIETANSVASPQQGHSL